MDLGIYGELTKTYILERITQEQIMEKYLQIPVVLDVLICAPPVLRKDKNPTCAFYYNQQGRLRFRDLSGYFWGDCFDVVAKIISVDASTKKGFQMVLHTVARDFRIHKYKDSNEVAKYDALVYEFNTKKKIKPKTIFKIVPREINYHDVSYWQRFNVSEKLLRIGKVYFAQEIYSSRDGYNFTIIYRYNPKDPAYCYYGGKDIKGIDNWKIYYPFRTINNPPRFHSNSSFLQGKHLITCDRVGIITKSYKDVLSFKSFGFQAVAPSAESVLLNKDDYFFMRTKFDYLISCMDYDRAGQRMAQLLRKTYGITPIMFTNGRFNSINYTVKDFAEYVHKFGKERTIELLTTNYEKYRQHFETHDKEIFELFKFIR